VDLFASLRLDAREILERNASMRILLVEDDESIREVFKLILETEKPLPDLLVDTASTGKEAAERVQAARPDLVLLDLTLAGEDGFEVYQKLRTLENGATTPVIAVTAHNLSEVESQAQELGFSGFVTKPIDFDKVLFPLLRKLLGPKTGDDHHHAA
jgi:CheY-like chemotaxis protein